MTALNMIHFELILYYCISTVFWKLYLWPTSLIRNFFVVIFYRSWFINHNLCSALGSHQSCKIESSYHVSVNKIKTKLKSKTQKDENPRPSSTFSLDLIQTAFSKSSIIAENNPIKRPITSKIQNKWLLK